MARMDIAIDLGTSFTSIFVSGSGVVLREPSVVAYYDNSKHTARAVGFEAYNMRGRAPEKTKISNPIVDGVINDADAAVSMLSEFIKRILPASYIIKPKIRAIVAVPMGITVDQRKVYEETLMRSGVDEVSMVNSVMLAGIGIELPIASAFGGCVVSIGGGESEFAVLSLCGIVKGNAINIGGDMIDRALLDRITGLYQIKLDLASARSIKEKIVSLIRNDCATTVATGIDIQTKNVGSHRIYGDELYEVSYTYYKNILDATKQSINSCSPAIVDEIKTAGVNIVGGGAKILGLKRFASEILNCRVNIPGDCEYATILGAGKLLSDKDLLDDVLRHA